MEYLTQEKKEALEKELGELKSVRRKEIADSLEYAKSLGDLSENAEYHQAREDQANCEDRISHLEQVLSNVVVMDEKNTTGKVTVGAKVTVLKKGDKEEREFTVLGSEEADSLNGKISNESPLGKALLGQAKGATVSFMSPKGEMSYTIKNIK